MKRGCIAKGCGIVVTCLQSYLGLKQIGCKSVLFFPLAFLLYFIISALKKNEFSRGFWSQVSTFLPYKYNGIPAVKRNPALVWKAIALTYMYLRSVFPQWSQCIAYIVSLCFCSLQLLWRKLNGFAFENLWKKESKPNCFWHTMFRTGYLT